MHRALAFIAALGLGSSLATADIRADTRADQRPEPPTLLWLCGLSQDATRLHCVADAEDAGADAAPGPDTAAVQEGRRGPAMDAVTVVRGTRFPLDRRQRWTVDLWSPYAGDPAWLELLARATLCYRTPDCDAFVHLPAAAALGRVDPQR